MKTIEQLLEENTSLVTITIYLLPSAVQVSTKAKGAAEWVDHHGTDPGETLRRALGDVPETLDFSGTPATAVISDVDEVSFL